MSGNGYDLHVMQVRLDPLEQAQRKAEKASARRADRHALASGSKSERELRRENEFLADFGRSGRLRLSASRSLH